MNLKQFFHYAVKVGIFVSLLTPLVMGPFGLSFSAFPKAIFFNSVIELTFVFYVGLLLFDRRFLPKFNIVLITLLFYEAVLFFTSLIGIDFSRSFFGDPERAEGLLLHLHLIIFLIIICSIYKTKDDWVKIMKVIVCVSAVSCLAAIGQKMSLWTLYGVSLPSRVSGTLSNPDFFAPYVISVFFISLFVYFTEKEKDLKFIWLSIAGLNVVSLILSGTRGAWLGFMVGASVILFYFLFIFYFKLSLKLRLGFLFFLLFISVILFIIISNPSAFHLRGNYYFETFYSMFELDLGSRLDVWNLSINAWQDRPIFGWGMESMSYVYDSYYRSEYSKHIPESMYFDHPHNKMIEILVVSGIFGLLSYLALFFVVGYCIFKYNNRWEGVSRWDKKVFSVVIFAFFVAYFFQNIFYFDAISNYILFFFVVGFVSVLFTKNEANRKEDEGCMLQPLCAAILILVVLLISILLYKINFQTIRSAMWFPRYSPIENRDPVKAVRGYKKSLDKKTIYTQDYYFAISERTLFIVENKAIDENNLNLLVDFLIELKPEIKKNILTFNRRPADNFEYLARIQKWEFLKTKEKKYLNEMGQTLNSAVLFNPEIAVFYQLLGEKEMLEGKYILGEEYFLKSYELSSKENSDKISLYKKIGVGYQRAGKISEAFKNFDKALDLNFTLRKFIGEDLKHSVNNENNESISFAEVIASKYLLELNNKEKGVEIYKNLIKSYPGYKTVLERHLNDYLTK